jgi:cytosine deaminase
LDVFEMSCKVFTPPKSSVYKIVNARVPVDLLAAQLPAAHSDRLKVVDITIEAGLIKRIEAHAKSAELSGITAVELDDYLVLPRFADVHTHLDKAQIWPRSPNPNGTFLAARTTVAADREARWTAEDVRARMHFSLRCAFAHGTGAIRTHIDSIGKQTAISWPIFAELRDDWKDRLSLQGVALFPVDLAINDETQFREIVATVARYGGVLGGLTFLGEPPDEKLDRALDRVIGAAAAHGLDLDFHVDESDSPNARTLARIAAAALRLKFKGRIVAGHCCSLALASDSARARIIEAVARAGIAVVSLPMCNMYLQDRFFGRTPRWRGVAPLHELEAAGVPVMVASDNTRDPFYAYGDLDMLEVFREATRILHLDHSDRPWARLLSVTPSHIMRLSHHGQIGVGQRADLVLTRARTFAELNARPQSDRAVLVGGLAVETMPPHYCELDALQLPPG